MIMNTGREIGRFTITGYKEPETLLDEFIIPEPKPEEYWAALEGTLVESSGGSGGVIGAVVGVLVVAGVIGGLIYTRKRKAEQI
jgi:hypothetical protein